MAGDTTLSDEFEKLKEENKRISGGDKKLEEFLNKRDYEKLKETEKERIWQKEYQEQVAKEKKERDEKKQEQERQRVQEISSQVNEWGEELCQWLVENKIDLHNDRTAEILNKLSEWGEEICKNLLAHRLSIGNTVEMVTLSLGEPTYIDQKELTGKTSKFRYVYGAPRKRAVYIWFKDGKVTKIKTP